MKGINAQIYILWLKLYSEEKHRKIRGKDGAPGETRTPDPLLRRQLLYPD